MGQKIFKGKNSLWLPNRYGELEKGKRLGLSLFLSWN